MKEEKSCTKKVICNNLKELKNVLLHELNDIENEPVSISISKKIPNGIISVYYETD